MGARRRKARFGEGRRKPRPEPGQYWCAAGAYWGMGWKPPQFPTEDHPNWNPDDPYADPVALLEHRELEILREKVELCYKREGVNQIVACRDIVDRYWESIKDVDIQLCDSTRYAAGHQNQAKR